jgi:hypothetical protein
MDKPSVTYISNIANENQFVKDNQPPGISYIVACGTSDGLLSEFSDKTVWKSPKRNAKNNQSV